MHKPNLVLVKEEKLRAWGMAALDTCAMPADQKETVLDTLVAANLRGVDTHGINLLKPYIRRYQKFPPDPIKVIKDSMAVCMLDGGRNLGAVVSAEAMKRAIEKALEYGVGFSLAYNSSHFGAAAYYTCQAAEQGLIGFAATTALVNLAPWGGFDQIVGKNPFSVSFPGHKFPVVLDIACSVAARQKVVTCAREGWPIPEGWALDKEGNPTTDANAALEGIFLPMGAHKGIGIALMIEHLIACLCQTGYSTEIVQNVDMSGPQGTAHMFAAVDPGKFLSKEDLDRQSGAFYQRFHACAKLPNTDKLYLPGELEWVTQQDRKANGIPVSAAIIKELDAFSDSIGVVRISEME